MRPARLIAVAALTVCLVVVGGRWTVGMPGPAASASTQASLGLPAPDAVPDSSPAGLRPTPTDVARNDIPRPPDRCSYSSNPHDWPPADETRACLRHKGTGRTVLLVGDSHAENWAPALRKVASARDWRLLTLTRAKCNPLDFVAVRGSDVGHPTVGEVCQRWKKVAYPAVIAKYQPDVVLIEGRSQIYDIQTPKGVVRPASERWHTLWERSWRWTLETLHASGARVGALSLQPTMAADVPDCLDRYGIRTSRCDMAIGKDALTARVNHVVETLPARYPYARSVPITRLLCPRGVCEAVLNGRITHADESHLTGRFSASLAGPLLRMLRAHNVLGSGS